MKTTTTNTINGVSCKRIGISDVQVGNVLHHAEQGKLGTVVSVERNAKIPRTDSAVLDNGAVLTHRGWQSKRIWKEVN